MRRSVYGITWFQERVFALLKWRPVLTRYRLSSSQARVRYDSTKIMRRLGWRPRASLAQRLDQLAAAQRTKTGEAPASVPPETTARLEQATQPGA